LGRAVDLAGLTASFRAHVNIVSLLTYLLTHHSGHATWRVDKVDRVDCRWRESSWVDRRVKSWVDRSSWSPVAVDRSSSSTRSFSGSSRDGSCM